MTVEMARVDSIGRLTDTCFDIWADAPQIAAACRPGNFVHIQCGGDTYLRRPISICDCDGQRIRLVFDVRGKGTALLSGRHAGEALDILGPVGNAFDTKSPGAPVLLIGGGIGVPPMLYTARILAEENPGARADMVMGYRTASAVMLERDFEAVCAQVRVATDDGSYGFCGYAADCAQALLEQKKYAAIYACGPKIMLKTAAALALQYKLPCSVSMEERMGCGVGACLVCACKTRADTPEGFAYRHVCKDGPVFDAGEVLFE